ncbi:hypothetical protein N7470_010260 [Penicillium chermesinum]|nr:hypothetical protein N7470_010260 [Penicillium chermesinum]
MQSGSISERPSSNYFGITVENTSNPPTSTPGPHAQKNWGQYSRAQSTLPSPKLQLYSQESVSEGLVNLLRSESDTDKDRRESAVKRDPSQDGSSDTKNGESTQWAQLHFGGNKPADHKNSTTPSIELAPGSSQWVSPERCADIVKPPAKGVLLLDVRPFAHYSQSNIRGSLNLCIPTTLLKRRSFDTQKLEGTFTSDLDKEKFAKWKECHTIIVYDAATTESKDSAPLLNVINKFQAEGWKGEGLILWGGYKTFSSRFPFLLHRPQMETASQSPKKRHPMSINLGSIAPVVGVGGVGQIALKLPDNLTESKRRRLPPWLRNASDAKDQGHVVSDKFLDLEKKELERMKQALSYDGSSASAGGASKKYRVAGIEKGTKNRYNDIYPFDHSRVRLEEVPLGGCDYVNANHIKAEYSNRRYIATQAPVPDTFNDFWRLIWEQDVRVLVSLTAEVERGQVKCHPFWQSGDYGPFKVKAYQERHINVEPHPVHSESQKSSAPDQRTQRTDDNNENPVIIVRHFSLYHTALPFQPLRDITQLQYPYWPDFGTTSQPAHLLSLIEQCNKAVRATSKTEFSSHEANPSGQRPILVHCSAGCGRTGTFCTVDSVLDMLKRQRAPDAQTTSSPEWVDDPNIDLITKTVEDFRTQRPSMVQNLNQFVLCYESILEWLVSRMDDEHDQR